MKTKLKFALFAIFFASFFVRLYDLNAESLFLDETYSVKIAKMDISQIIDASKEDVHPPLYYLILHYWIDILGDSESMIRLLSAFFGLAAVFMIYKIGTALFDRQTGVLSAFILGLSVFHLHYSQEARMYSLMTLLVLISFYFFIRLNNKNKIASAGYIVSSSLLLYTHVYGIFIIAAQNIYKFWEFLKSKNSKKIKQWLTLQIFIVILFLPWSISLMHQVERESSGNGVIGYLQKPTFNNTLHYILLANMYESALWLLAVLMILAFIMDYRQMRRRTIDNYSLLVLWLVSSFIFPILISQFTPIFQLRLTLGSLPAFYLLVARGISCIKNRRAKAMIIVTLFLLFSVNVYGYYARVDREQWREAISYVETHANKGDVVLFHPAFLETYPYAYYGKRTDLVIKSFPEKSRHVNEENLQQLASEIKNYPRIWFVISHSKDQESLILKTLEKSHKLSEHKEFLDIKVYVFEK